MDVVTPDIEILSKNLYASLDPSLSNDDRAIVYQVGSYISKVTITYFSDIWTSLYLCNSQSTF